MVLGAVGEREETDGEDLLGFLPPGTSLRPLAKAEYHGLLSWEQMRAART